jgi:ribonuclease HI
LIIYCDGACLGNPGKSGSGIAVYDNQQLVLFYGEYNEHGTNNIAELNALKQALLIAQESSVKKSIIYSDSRYSIDSITKWAYSWKKKSWTKKSGEIKNLDIIKTTHALYEDLKHRVDIAYVKAHSGVEGNELADRMALMAITSKSGEYKKHIYNSIEDVLRL